MPAHDYTFASDNAAGICPEAMAALERANHGCAPGYGSDTWTERAKALLSELFETECEIAFVFNGTAANSLALSVLCHRHMSIICHAMAHVDTDECGAPEFFTGGSKVIGIEGPGGKLLPGSLPAIFSRGHGIHTHKPGALSLTQSTELGTVYTAAEIAALAEVAHAQGMTVHMDGARFANAVASLDASPAEITWKSGVDVLCFGGTKNGMLGTEAVIFFNPDLARDLPYRVKQSGQLASKMRFAAAQWVGMLETGAWLRNAQRANDSAQTLASRLQQIPGCRLQVEPEVNGVFIEIPKHVASALLERGWHFYPFFGENGYRIMCSWETQPETIDRFVADVALLAR